MSTIALYLDNGRHLVEHSDQILTRHTRHCRPWNATAGGSGSDYPAVLLGGSRSGTVRDFALVAQRLEMVRRLEEELDTYVVELAATGACSPCSCMSYALGSTSCAVCRAGLLPTRVIGIRPRWSRASEHRGAADPLTVARAAGFSHNVHLETHVTTRGFRQMAQINRLPSYLGDRLIEHFGTLQALFGASSTDLQAVEGVGESRARVIRDGLVRLAESAYTERIS